MTEIHLQRDTVSEAALTRRTFVGRAAVALAGAGTASSLLAREGWAATPATLARPLADITVLNILQPGMWYCAEYVADLRGYYRQAGLDVTTQTTRGSAPAIQGIIAGKGLTAWVGGIETMLAIDKGAPLVNIAMLYYRSPLAIVSTRDAPLRSPRDLDGTTIGVPSVGGTSELTVNLLLSKFDIPLDQVDRQIVGPTPGSFELIDQGRVDGFVIGAGQIPIFRSMFPEAVYLRTDRYVSDGLCFITTRETLERDKPALTAYVRATRRAMREIANDGRTGFRRTIRLFRNEFDYPELDDGDVARGTLQFYVGNWFAEGAKNVLRPAKPGKWRLIYDQLVRVDAVKSGQNPRAWIETSVAR